MDSLHRHICPRNCYDTCSIISTTRNGRLVAIEGDPEHSYTRGKLCPKAMDEIHKVYHTQRVKYPMRQRKRFSGQWERITWDEALNTIAQQILTIKEKYGTTLPIALNKYSGNFGIMRNAWEGLLKGIGPTTRAIGSPCWSAGMDAQHFDFGVFFCSDPLEMEKAKLIWLWGVNPAWNAVHQMPIIFRAMEKGAKVVSFDTHLSATAARAHEFVQVNPGTDGLLALGMCKIIAEKGFLDPELSQYSLGHEEFLSYLNEEVDLRKCSQITGVSIKTMTELALEYSTTKPACIWAGFGLQRYSNGGQNLRAIDALGALTGNIGRPGGGVQYGHMETWSFAGPLAPQNYHHSLDCKVDINQFAPQGLKMDPPLKMLLVACRNPIQQEGKQREWQKLIDQLDLIVVSDLFHTRTSLAADLFLPVTTHYEHWDINASYWHYYVGINEPAIKPVGEARSDLQIAWDLSRVLNELDPGSSAFPTSGSEKEWVLGAVGEDLCQILELRSPQELLDGPKRANFPSTSWQEKIFRTPSGKYEFYSEKAQEYGHDPLPKFKPPYSPPEDTPLRLLTPHHISGLNSQIYPSDTDVYPLFTEEIKANYYVAHIHPQTAMAYNVKSREQVALWNKGGSLTAAVQWDESVALDTVVIYQENRANIKVPHLNLLNSGNLTDMGPCSTGAYGLALNETFVGMRKMEGRS